MLNKTIVFTFMQIDKPEAKSQTKPKIPKSQTQKGKGNLASGLSLLKSKSGSGPVGNAICHTLSITEFICLSLSTMSLVLINVRVCISLEKHLMNHP